MNTPEQIAKDAAEWIQTIPADLYQANKNQRVANYGFRAGPSYIAGKNWRGPCTLDMAITKIVTYRHSFRAAHIRFESGLCFWFHPSGFVRSEQRVPSAGVTVHHPK